MKPLRAIFTFLAIVLYAPTTSATDTEVRSKEYEIHDQLMIPTPDGAMISGMMVRPKNSTSALPVVFQFTIYARPQERDLESLKDAADRGYVGVIFYSRGKYLSTDDIWPYEFDGKDAYTAIDWISKQAWCNGHIGMYGGSYNGFTQWAASKRLHPALKTIVPMVAGQPGMGLPMENNIFINPNYQWAFYVGNNRLLDTKTNDDRQRFRQSQFKWWYSGRAYREFDEIDGTPNKWLQKWLQHPSYDDYWKDMVPQEAEFAQITIPVLTIDGYYNDSQVSSLNYLRQHLRYAENAQHYLVIGPYGHFGAQRGGEVVLNDLPIHPNALFDIKALIYAWFDHTLKGQTMPAMLKDRVNYFPIDESQWRHAKSIEDMSPDKMRLYLTTTKKQGDYQLQEVAPSKPAYLQQSVDFRDRRNSNNDYYPAPIVRDDIDRRNGFIFVSDALKEDLLFNGAFTGEIVASINKRDMDFGITLYELTDSGKYFHLSYTIHRASYIKDPSQRQLLKPHQITHMSLGQTRLISKRLKAGSRIVAYLNINKNPFSQLNYGSGKDVSDESMADANYPLKVRWFNSSFIEIPIMRITQTGDR
ncbi:CocE/NonD family hydrolase [Undibacterium cyanobacteriorum]|uniref:CocE/NonD family hydrolase n=1 Tax=Undibacterium cyanobacteriorum TaxID=3073561 RepID=A0ABY9RJQ7_9BURK|nr:CocE/NonD family hydrolase [Undibacterium sp. 20NA77.5]WMW81455.1 CocE/NonD family hydrolase [Undibacterium sp. 20NA77.5]